jgi:hypothetical protein
MTVVGAVIIPLGFDCSKVASRLLAFFTGIEVSVVVELLWCSSNQKL